MLDRDAIIQKAIANALKMKKEKDASLDLGASLTQKSESK